MNAMRSNILSLGCCLVFNAGGRTDVGCSGGQIL